MTIFDILVISYAVFCFGLGLLMAAFSIIFIFEIKAEIKTSAKYFTFKGN